MKVFITGATGYIGFEIAKILTSKGIAVVGLTRSDHGENRLKKIGVEPFRGSLEAIDSWLDDAAAADGVIHTAFDHKTDWAEAVKLDLFVHEALLSALAGTNKVFVTSNGMGIFGDTGDEIVDESTPLQSSPRFETEQLAIKAAGAGIRVCSIRLALLVYGLGGSVFIPNMIAAAKKHGKSFYIEDGSNRISTVHVTDAAALYALAIEKAGPGSVFHASAGRDVSLMEIAEAIGGLLKIPIESVNLEQARNFWHPTWAQLLSLNNRTTGEKAAKELGWTPQIPVGILEDIRGGTYKAT